MARILSWCVYGLLVVFCAGYLLFLPTWLAAALWRERWYGPGRAWAGIAATAVALALNIWLMAEFVARGCVGHEGLENRFMMSMALCLLAVLLRCTIERPLGDHHWHDSDWH